MPNHLGAEEPRDDGGPGILRSEEWPYGLPDLSMADVEKVHQDSILFFRYLSLYVMAEEVRSPQDPRTEFVLEQPRDPKEYRTNEDVEQRQYMSMFRTQEQQQFQDMYNFYKVDFIKDPWDMNVASPQLCSHRWNLCCSCRASMGLLNIHLKTYVPNHFNNELKLPSAGPHGHQV